MLRFCMLALVCILAACGSDLSPGEELALDIEEKLADLETVQGQLSIRSGATVLEQELWQERPKFLRTETEAGPDAFDGTIVVLNDSQSWLYNPALNMVTIADRSDYSPELASEAGAGSRLERLPSAIVDALRRGYALNIAGDERIAGRDVTHVELFIGDEESAFPPGPLQLWLDERFGYPLGYQDASGLHIRFASVIFNEAIDPVTFEFVPPPGARVERAASAP